MNKDGITITSLVLTVIILAILTAAGGAIATNLIGQADEQNLISNMLLIQTQVKIIMEKVASNNDTSYYVGTKLKSSPNKIAIANGVLTDEELEKDTIYIYDRQTLNDLGLEKVNLSSGEVFLVDYSNSDVISTKGRKKEDKTMLYRLSQANSSQVSYESNNIQLVTFEAGKDYINAEVFEEADITEYQFLIGLTEQIVKSQEGNWFESSKHSFTNLSPNTSYFIMVKAKTATGQEKTSKIYRVKTQ